jgi:hypothetical protein
MQSAIFETHAIYVSASVHDGWDRIKKAKRLEDAVIGPPRTDDFGGHAFAIVGYTAEGFIVQNSWGPDWGFHGCAPALRGLDEERHRRMGTGARRSDEDRSR